MTPNRCLGNDNGRRWRRWSIDQAGGLERAGLVHPASRLDAGLVEDAGQPPIGASAKGLRLVDGEVGEVWGRVRACSGRPDAIRVRAVGSDCGVLVLFTPKAVPEDERQEHEDADDEKAQGDHITDGHLL